jgi:hypothetical protein
MGLRWHSLSAEEAEVIFAAARFVVVDDKPEHLRAIVQAFQQLGSPCIGIQFDPAGELDPLHFRGVRCLFLDLHLIDARAGTDHRRHYAVIASILERTISSSGGPFVLIIWTEHPHVSAELREYLDVNLDTAKPYARPLAVLTLAKEQFINTGTGAVQAPDELRAAVEAAVTSNPQLAALLGWETDVLVATGDTLASLLNLIPVEQRTFSKFPEALDGLLSRLAIESVGQQHVGIDHRAAVTNALAPILSDRIINQHVSLQTRDLWRRAITRHGHNKLPPLSMTEAGQLNRILHLAVPGAEVIGPTDWGAVVDWPHQWTDAELASRTGLTIAQMLGGELRIESSDRARCTPLLVRIGAACDYAQNRNGPITFLLAFEIPENALRKKDSAGNPVKLPEAVWRSPTIVAPNSVEASRLHVHIRFPIVVLPAACTSWQARYRLREQLLMTLITSSASYTARPGIVQLPAL